MIEWIAESPRGATAADTFYSERLASERRGRRNCLDGRWAHWKTSSPRGDTLVARMLSCRLSIGPSAASVFHVRAGGALAKSAQGRSPVGRRRGRQQVGGRTVISVPSGGGEWRSGRPWRTWVLAKTSNCPNRLQNSPRVSARGAARYDYDGRGGGLWIGQMSWISNLIEHLSSGSQTTRLRQPLSLRANFMLDTSGRGGAGQMLSSDLHVTSRNQCNLNAREFRVSHRRSKSVKCAKFKPSRPVVIMVTDLLSLAIRAVLAGTRSASLRNHACNVNTSHIFDHFCSLSWSLLPDRRVTGHLFRVWEANIVWEALSPHTSARIVQATASDGFFDLGWISVSPLNLSPLIFDPLN